MLALVVFAAIVPVTCSPAHVFLKPFQLHVPALVCVRIVSSYTFPCSCVFEVFPVTRSPAHVFLLAGSGYHLHGDASVNWNLDFFHGHSKELPDW